MFVFVFLWAPSLATQGEGIPHGLIFSLMMLSCMAGASIGGLLLSRSYKPESCIRWVSLLSALALSGPFLYYTSMEHTLMPVQDIRGITLPGKILLSAFCVFEGCVGMSWPIMMSLRAKHLPDELRTTLMNCFRVPLNIGVGLLLHNGSVLSLGVMLGLCVGFLLPAVVVSQHLEAAVIADPAPFKMAMITYSPNEYNI